MLTAHHLRASVRPIFQEATAQCDLSGARDASTIPRNIGTLIDRIDLTPEEQGLSISQHGHLAGILALATHSKRLLDESDYSVERTKLVAGARNHRQFEISTLV
jgi:hypothetical protein